MLIDQTELCCREMWKEYAFLFICHWFLHQYPIKSIGRGNVANVQQYWLVHNQFSLFDTFFYIFIFDLLLINKKWKESLYCLIKDCWQTFTNFIYFVKQSFWKRIHVFVRNNLPLYLWWTFDFMDPLNNIIQEISYQYHNLLQ